MKESPELPPRSGGSFLEVTKVQYLEGERKIAFKVGGDDAVEVYDFLENRKWRFAPQQGLERGASGGGLWL